MPAPATGRRRGYIRIAAGCAVTGLFGALAFSHGWAPSKAPSRSRVAADIEVPQARFELEVSRPNPVPVAQSRVTAPAPTIPKYSGPRASASPKAPIEVPSPAVTLPLPIRPTAPSIVASAAPPNNPHRVPFASLAAWSKPGLCASTSDAAQTRDAITAKFNVVEPDDGGKLYLDPRLPAAAEQPVLADLRQAEVEVGRRLGLSSARPLVFVYADQSLMKAAACINEDVVAFYDGALHIVANRADLRQSLLHEYTHHALFSSGFIGPAWAQEGIAMSLAQERWWRDPQYLRALIANPFSLEDMDRTVPYRLPSEQAVLFYVQSAALVECLLQTRKWSPADLLSALRAGAGADALTYDLPELDQPGFLRSCALSGS